MIRPLGREVVWCSHDVCVDARGFESVESFVNLSPQCGQRRGTSHTAQPRPLASPHPYIHPLPCLHLCPGTTVIGRPTAPDRCEFRNYRGIHRHRLYLDCSYKYSNLSIDHPERCIREIASHNQHNYVAAQAGRYLVTPFYV